MVVIPKQQPVLENLNIYYLDVRKFRVAFILNPMQPRASFFSIKTNW
jgi:hypothetical protein